MIINHHHCFHYAQIGPKSKPVLLCLPGYCDSAKSFSFFSRFLRHRYRIIILEPPYIYQHQSYTLTSLTSHLSLFIKFKKLKKFSLLAFSFSAFPAINYAHKHSNQIESLFLLNMTPSYFLSPLSKLAYKLLKPILTSRFFCHLYALGNTNQTLRRLFGRQPLSQVKIDRIKTHPVSIYQTVFNIIGSDLTKKFNQTPATKTIVLCQDDKVIPPKKHLPYVRNLTTNLFVFKYGAHSDRKHYWRNVISLFK